MPTERVLRDFEGTWTLHREIRLQAGPPSRLEGTATWRACEAGLAYAETGTLRVAGAAPMVATRRYVWAPDLSVYFDDGRFFHKVPPAGGPATHWCAPDHYEGQYDFDDWPGFTVAWTVTGPRKAYRMISHYARQTAG